MFSLASPVNSIDEGAVGFCRDDDGKSMKSKQKAGFRLDDEKR